jgi:nucleoside-diphosphate-sugar epimerase
LRSKKNILIIGGTGFIGYHLAKKCLKNKWQVTSISTKPPKKIRYLSKVNYIYCDISKKKSLKKNIKFFYTYVVNLGGYVDHSNKAKTRESHYTGCKNLTNIFLKNPPKAFIQMGSSVEYGNVKSPQKENSKCNPKTVYGRAKLSSTKHLINLYVRKKFPSVVLRLYLAYGPKQDLNRFLPIIIDGCLKNKRFPCSSGDQLRDFVYIDDVVGAILKSLTNEKVKGKIINIGSGRPKKIKQIINYLKNVLKGGFPEFGKIKFRKDEILKIYPSIKRSTNLLKWHTKVPFEKGIKKTIQSYE